MAIFNRSFLLVFIGLASSNDSSVPSDHSYVVSIDEIRSNLLSPQTFSGQFTHEVTLSDGSVREVTLRPVQRNGQELVELTDKSAGGIAHSYMGPFGTTVDGNLMINVKDLAQLKAEMGKLSSTH
jgi:hypothetical protein